MSDALRALFDGADTGLALVGPNEVLITNPAVEQLLGLKAGSPRPSWCNFGAGVHRTADASVAYRCSDVEFEGKPCRIISAWDETTVREAALAAHNRQRHRQKEQRIAALGQLSSGLAHELNNALQVVRIGTELLAMDNPSAAAPVLDATQRMANIVRHLMAFAGSKVGQVDQIDVSKQISAIDMDDVFGEDVEIATHVESNLRIDLITGELERIVSELLDNSREAMDDVGMVSLVVKGVDMDRAEARSRGLRTGSYVEIVVDDDGIGLDPSSLERATEPFFTTRGAERAGLGLAAVQGIVARVGGAMQLESPGRGATVTVWIPQSTAAPPEGVESRPLTGAQVLLAEDDAAVREMIQVVLERAGVAVIGCRDGLAALDAADHNVFDALITDVKMPRMDGPTLAAELRMRRPELPILFITGFADVDRPDSVADAVVLNKPFDASKLRKALGELLALAPAALQPRASGTSD